MMEEVLKVMRSFSAGGGGAVFPRPLIIKSSSPSKNDIYSSQTHPDMKHFLLYHHYRMIEYTFFSKNWNLNFLGGLVKLKMAYFSIEK